jgi:hypothetical protein
MFDLSEVADRLSRTCRMFKKAFQQGRRERGVEAYCLLYVEPLSDARTKLEDFFNILLESAPTIR